MSDKTGGPAFPAPDAAKARFGSGNEDLFMGMTLRDYFAAKALGGLCADPTTEGTKESDLAEECYSIADAMLKERNK